MAIYVNGKKITSIYVGGASIGLGYSNGKLVFTKKTGWQMGTSCTLTISSANNNSIAGTILLNRYDYYDSGAITENYYEVASVNVSRSSEGEVELNLGAGTSVVFGNAAHSAEYYAPSNGIFKLSASELSSMYRLKKQSGVLELGTSKTVTSYYMEPIWDMSIATSGAAAILLNSGWAIAHNRTSRLSMSTSNVYNLSTLNVPGEGTWPVYAYAPTATEATVSGLTCGVTAHQTYDSQNIRHLGWVTVASGSITNVSSLAQYTGAGLTKSISGTNLVIGAGYATDTDGMRVYVPAVTYSYADMIAPAQDTSEEITAVHESDKYETTGLTATPNPRTSCSIHGPASFRLYGSVSGTRSGTGVIDSLRYKINGEASWRQKNFSSGSRNRWDDLSISSGQEIVEVMAASHYSLTQSSGTTWSATAHIYLYQTVTTEGIPQSRQIYVKVTRNQNNNSKTTATQTTTGDSSPYVSYVYIGTINVARNAQIGTIS